MGLKTYYSVAVVGAGYMAEEHIKAFSAIEGVKVTGIFSRTKEKADLLANKYSILYCANSIEELYTLTHADLVVVAVRETAVVEIIDNLLAYDWTLLFEKPFGLNLEESGVLCQKVAASKKNAFVALNRRFYSSTTQVFQDLTQDQGKRFIHVVDYENLEQVQSFNYSSEILKNWMYANSIHLIDYLCFFGRGKIVNVETIPYKTFDKYTTVVSKISFESGDEGLYQGLWYGPGPWSVSVTTDSTYYEMKPLEQAAKRTFKNRQYQFYKIDEDRKSVV